MLVYKIEKVDSVLNKSSNCNTMFLNLLHCSVLSGWSLVFFSFLFPFISPKNGLASDGEHFTRTPFETVYKPEKN